LTAAPPTVRNLPYLFHQEEERNVTRTVLTRLAATAAAALLALGAGACGSSNDSGGDSGSGGASGGGGAKLSGKIAVLLPDSKSSDRWETADRRFFEEAFRAAGLSKSDYLIQNAEGDPATQRSQAEQAITQGAKVILLVNLDPGSGAAIISSAKSQGVTMIDYDRLTVGGDADYYVSGDATEAGRLQAKGLIEDLKGKSNPRIAILDGAPTDSFATDLKKGYMEVLKGSDLQIAAHQAVPNWDGQKALTIYEQMLQASKEPFDGTLAANDTIANATISARQSRRLDPVPTSGLDATAEALQHLLAGEQSFTVYFSIKDQATKAANLAIQLARKQQPTGINTEVDNGKGKVPTILLKPQTVRKDNIASTVIADDFASWDDVCTGKYEKLCPSDR
jgi:D-xylose transport system substrate-binding protein